MIAFARVVYLAFLPSLLIGLGLLIVSRRAVAESWRTTLQIVAALCLLVPQLLAIFLGSYSSELRPYQQLVFLLWTLGMAALCALAWRDSSAGRNRSRFVLAVGGVTMAVAGVFLGRAVVGDYLLPHERTIGRVGATEVVHRSRLPDSYRVLIGGRSYDITVDLLMRIHEGDVVAADVGVGTSTILGIRRDVPGGAKPAGR